LGEAPLRRLAVDYGGPPVPLVRRAMLADDSRPLLR
jgi:hypothetical protein